MREIRFISKYYLVDPYKERKCKRKGGKGEREGGRKEKRKGEWEEERK